MELKQVLGEVLRALKIISIGYVLNGSGDSGEAEFEYAEYKDGRTASALPEIPIFITDTGQVRCLPELLENIVADAPEGDWVNNEGGYGNVYVRPFEDDAELSIESDMVYREEGDYGDDDDAFIDEDLIEPDDAGSEGLDDIVVVVEGVTS